jgi:hypothetical protein
LLIIWQIKAKYRPKRIEVMGWQIIIPFVKIFGFLGGEK